nr:MAG TPA: hypothetical protein [Caudoviricetes sp.]
MISLQHTFYACYKLINDLFLNDNYYHDPLTTALE